MAESDALEKLGLAALEAREELPPSSPWHDACRTIAEECFESAEVVEKAREARNLAVLPRPEDCESRRRRHRSRL